VFNFRKIVEKRAHKHPSRTNKGFVPQHLRRSYLISLQTYYTKGIATFESKEKVTRNHIIFFHGGAYIFEATPNHWKLAEKIVKKSFCRMTLVDYPLAGKASVVDHPSPE
jgi:monoterpene epsilon-lactone hydrolase